MRSDEVGPSPKGEPERGPLVGTSSPWTMRAAAICSWILSVGFGLPCIYAMWYFARRGEVWTFLGFPTYGHGPFEDVGLATSTPLLACFLVVCVAEFEAGSGAAPECPHSYRRSVPRRRPLHGRRHAMAARRNDIEARSGPPGGGSARWLPQAPVEWTYTGST